MINSGHADVLDRLTALELKVSLIDAHISNHSRHEENAWAANTSMHERLMDKLNRSLIWQSRVKIIIGTVATIIGAIALLVYQYAPWIWDALPKHGHTH